MTREQKLALIVGFALVLVVGVLISDQLSVARRSVDPTEGGLAMSLEPSAMDYQPGLGRQLENIPAPSVVRYPPVDQTRVVLVDPVTEPSIDESTSLAAAALEGLESVGRIMREAQDNGIPAYNEVPVIEMQPRPLDRPMEAPASRTATNDPAPREDVRAVRTHRVDEGETLWSIAKKYYGDGAAATELAKYNEKRIGKGGMIREGASLLIPDREDLGLAQATPRTPTTAKATETRTAKAEPKKTDTTEKAKPKTEAAKTYTVKSGDTLQKISEKHFGTTRRWMEIVAMNKDVIDDEDNVRVGTVLKIPSR